MPKQFWPFALNYVMHVHNRTPNSSIDFKSPYEMLLGVAPATKHIRRFGCKAFYLDQKLGRSKVEPRGKPGYILECNKTGYKLLDAKEKIVIRAKHVKCIESKVYGDEQSKKVDEELIFDEELRNEEHRDEENQKEQVENEENDRNKTIDEDDFEIESIEMFEENEDEMDKVTSEKLGELYLTQEDNEPVSYNEALRSSDKRQWLDAINDEYNAHEECQTWKIIPKVEVPEGSKIIKSRWVHKRKRESSGKTRYRSRLVAKGFADNNFYDRKEIYAPVARLGDVRFLLSSANKLRMSLAQFDIKTAFLHGELEKPVYMELPDGLCERQNESEEFKKTHVCKLQRALYGLKVSPKRWHTRFQKTMKELDLEPYPFQSCLFSNINGDSITILLLYVDDILIATNNVDKLKEIETELKQEYKITSLGEPKKFLGLEIARDTTKNEIKLYQTTFTKKIIKRFGLEKGRSVYTPMITNDNERKLREERANTEKLENVPYRQAIGSLLYLANGTRPDIAFAVNLLSRKQCSFTMDDWSKVKRVIRYLNATSNFGLNYSGKTDTLNCFADASLGLNDEQGKSTSGYVISIFDDVIAWRMKRQSQIALSSAEAEYVAMGLACREIINLKEMSKRLLKINLSPVLYEDNKAAIELAKTQDSTTLKHVVHLNYHFVRDLVQRDIIKIDWIPSEEQLGDFLTKALAKPKFVKFRDLCISPINSDV